MPKTIPKKVKNLLQEKRRHIWEIKDGWHCSIIGTCLTLHDVRGLAKKAGFKTFATKTRERDALLHGCLVKEVGQNSTTTKLINKLLDKKYAKSIKELQKIDTLTELSDAWDISFKKGNIPGPYWATLSHPKVDNDLELRSYGDIHMLSHLVGASNRADRIALQHYENQKNDFEERLAKQNIRSVKKLQQKDVAIQKLQHQLSTLKGELISSKTKAAMVPVGEFQDHQNSVIEIFKIKKLEERLFEANFKINALEASNNKLSSAVPVLQSEMRGLENIITEENPKHEEKNCSFDLDGNCILYVGGRAREVCRLQTLITSWNGKLIHHDGGLEKSINELASAVRKADTVVFPIDCVSHNAMSKVKRLCQQSMKPFIPLRTTGLACLINGLREKINCMSSVSINEKINTVLDENF